MQTQEIHELARPFRARDAADPQRFPSENLADLFEARVIGGPFPEALGGRGWRLRTAVEAIRTIAAVSPSTALVAAMPLGLAGACFATGPEWAPEDWRQRWREQVDWAAAEYRAQRLFAACNSEKGAGGSLTSITTVADRVDGSFRLTGEKILASGGRYATWFLSTAKVEPGDLPGAGPVEFFLVPTDGAGVDIREDWDGFGMWSSESQSVRYTGAAAHALLGFPNLIDAVRPLQYWFCLFAAIPLGCARGMLDALTNPAPASHALRTRLADAVMRYEALEAYLYMTAEGWRPGADAAFAGRVLRMKTHVSAEATRLCAELFSLGGGRHYRRTDELARLMADSFAGTALRPPLSLALDTLAEQFSTMALDA